MCGGFLTLTVTVIVALWILSRAVSRSLRMIRMVSREYMLCAKSRVWMYAVAFSTAHGADRNLQTALHDTPPPAGAWGKHSKKKAAEGLELHTSSGPVF